MTQVDFWQTKLQRSDKKVKKVLRKMWCKLRLQLSPYVYDFAIDTLEKSALQKNTTKENDAHPR